MYNTKNLNKFKMETETGLSVEENCRVLSSLDSLTPVVGCLL